MCEESNPTYTLCRRPLSDDRRTNLHHPQRKNSCFANLRPCNQRRHRPSNTATVLLGAQCCKQRKQTRTNDYLSSSTSGTLVGFCRILPQQLCEVLSNLARVYRRKRILPSPKSAPPHQTYDIRRQSPTCGCFSRRDTPCCHARRRDTRCDPQPCWRQTNDVVCRLVCIVAKCRSCLPRVLR